MGMFDTVKHKPEPCPVCGKLITEWQTKSGHNHLGRVSRLKLIYVARRYFNDKHPDFYGYCYFCRGSILYRWSFPRWHKLEFHDQDERNAYYEQLYKEKYEQL